ncbi:MAG: FTR1 family protein [Betaproteobacteria bacterium]
MLRALVNAKASPDVVAAQAHAVAAGLLKAYPFPVAPSKTPDLAHGAKLFAANCAACHGVAGKADGPLAAKLNPRPTNLVDHARARERSIFALYQIVTQGVPGTPMASFGSRMSDEERWNLAFFVSTLSYTEKDRAKGAEIWKSDPAVRGVISSLQDLTQITESAMATKVGAEAALPTLAWVRAHPGEVASARPSHIAAVKTQIANSLDAARAGEKAAASRIALAAYLDNFEPLEPALRARDASLLAQIESAMTSYRSHLAGGSVPEMESAEAALQKLLDRAELALATAASDFWTTFVGSLTILLREGVEALLVVVAMIAFLRKAEQRKILPYVHAGWVVALAGGGVTWVVATYLVGISGASRELTEGFSSVFAAIVLLAVGIWMHQKSVAGRWQFYLKKKLSAAMGKRTAWLLFGLSFISVYREVFETVLFYIALWNQGNGVPLLAGLGCGLLVLGVLAVVLLRTSARLPIGQFFAASSVLVAILAVVLVGKGIAGLQEAGLLDVSIVTFPRIDVLGVFPTSQSLLAQAVVLVIGVLAFILNVRSGRVATTATN